MDFLENLVVQGYKAGIVVRPETRVPCFHQFIRSLGTALLLTKQTTCIVNFRNRSNVLQETKVSLPSNQRTSGPENAHLRIGL